MRKNADHVFQNNVADWLLMIPIVVFGAIWAVAIGAVLLIFWALSIAFKGNSRVRLE